MDLAAIRNFGIAAHIDAGKTTVSERMLFHSGVERRAGRVDEGTAVLDWMAEERERGITITAAATTIPWRGLTLNLIDTPGHVDFTVEVERCMRVLDGAILVLDAVVGVQAQSEAVWREMRRHRVPAVAFVNKCDRAGADFLAAVNSASRRLGVRAVPIQYPVFEDGAMVAVYDFVRGRLWDFREPNAVHESSECEPPESIAEEVGVLRSELLDTLGEFDEELLEAVVEERETPFVMLRRALRRATLTQELLPVLCGAALHDVGIEPLMDAVVDYLPSPLEVPPVHGVDPKTGEEITRHCDPSEPACALAFKLHAGRHGDLTFVRIYSGTITPGMVMLNPRGDRKERVQRVQRMHAEAGTPLEQAVAGDIVALTGLKWTSTGDTLCTKEAPILLEQLSFSEPVITRIVEPTNASDRDRLGQALERLQHEDPTFRVQLDEASGQWRVAGMGELHLEVMEHRLSNEFGLTPRVGQPRVAYREAVVSPGRGRGLIDRELGGKDAYAEVELELVPEPEAQKLVVEWGPEAAIPPANREAVAAALVGESQSGPRFGHPMVQAKVRVLAAASREGRESELAYLQAAVSALRQALHQATVSVEEPRMSFEVQSPADFASGIIADLNARGAELAEVVAEGETRILRGTVPLYAMFGYSTAVRSLSQGRASFTMLPHGYQTVSEPELVARGMVWA
ncbi:MAG: elongation factor G [Planctomycetes bacterium]|nr:elongation factor G [Planctomycetota bacterium]MCB9905702.1 elongation factor G [Planctomycetota bacterium]